MNTQRNFLLYNDPNHWNSDLRTQFIKNRLGMWDKSYYGFTRNEAAENERREREEMQATFSQ